MKLLIDDMRNLESDVTARTASAAKAVLCAYDWDEVILDHDLGEGDNGYDVLKFMMKAQIFPETISLVSSNPVGRQNQKNVLVANGYTTKDNSLFFREVNKQPQTHICRCRVCEELRAKYGIFDFS